MEPETENEMDLEDVVRVYALDDVEDGEDMDTIV